MGEVIYYREAEKLDRLKRFYRGFINARQKFVKLVLKFRAHLMKKYRECTRM